MSSGGGGGIGAKAPTRRSHAWVSNNRFLVGGIKKVPARNPNFEYEETKQLIKIWGEPKLQRTLITSHKKHNVIAQIAERMKSAGYHRSPEEINTRIKNLKCFYNRLKKESDVNALPPDRHLWKHFHAMDEIMTRPIFSVRPGETPPPAKNWDDRENVPEKQAKVTIEDSEDEECKSEADDAFDTYSIHEMMDTEMENSGTFENDMMDLHNVNKINGESEEVQDDDKKPIIKIKDEPMSDEDEPLKNLLIPKSEPMEEKDILPPPKPTPPLVTSVQSHAGTLSLGNLLTNTITTTCAGTQSMPQLIIQKPMNLPNIYPKVSTAQSTSAVIGQQGKISLVPTSMLIHQQQQQGNMGVQPQKIYIQNPSTSTSQVGTATAASIVQTANGMKVLLVNTGKHNPSSQPPTLINTSNGSIITSAPTELPKNMPSPVVTQSRPQLQPVQVTQPPKLTATHPQRKESSSSFTKNQMPKELAGFRTLLTHLITLQTSNNELEKQRLALEKERLEFEKSSVEKFFNILPTLFGTNIDTNSTTSNTASTSTVNGTNNGLQMLIIPKTEKIDKDYVE